MLPKEKCDGRIKARGCTDGRSQRIYDKIRIKLANSIAESKMLSYAKDPKEKRYATVTDKSDEFLHADMNKEVHMQL